MGNSLGIYEAPLYFKYVFPNCQFWMHRSHVWPSVETLQESKVLTKLKFLKVKSYWNALLKMDRGKETRKDLFVFL